MDQHDHAPSHRLDGKGAVVTGAAQGPGEAIARCFAAEGAVGLALGGRDRGYPASAASGLMTGANLDVDHTITGVSDAPLPVPA